MISSESRWATIEGIYLDVYPGPFPFSPFHLNLAFSPTRDLCEIMTSEGAEYRCRRCAAAYWKTNWKGVLEIKKSLEMMLSSYLLLYYDSAPGLTVLSITSTQSGIIFLVASSSRCFPDDALRESEYRCRCTGPLICMRRD